MRNYKRETKRILKVVFNRTDQAAELLSDKLLELEKQIGGVIAKSIILDRNVKFLQVL